MNPLTNVKNIKKLSEQELKSGGKSSWHDQYKDSAWIFVGGLPYDLTEGDIICVFSQYGEIVHINLVRDKETGKQKGYCFLCYEDQRSTILAVDNFNGIKILNRTIRVDHVQNYKAPKESKKNPIDDETRLLREEGCAPLSTIAQASTSNKLPTQAKEPTSSDIKVPPRLPIESIKSEKLDSNTEKSKKLKKKLKKEKKERKKKKSKKEKKSKKKKRKHSSSSSSSNNDESETTSSSDSDSSIEVKRKKRN